MSKEYLLTKIEKASLPSLPVKKLKASLKQAITPITISRKFLRQEILTASPNASKSLYAITKGMNLIQFDPETQETRSEVHWKMKTDLRKHLQDESRVAVGNTKGQIYLIDVQSFKVTHHINFDPHCKGIRDIAISPDGSYAQVLIIAGDLIRANLTHGSQPVEAKF